MPPTTNPLGNTLEIFSASIEDFITSLGTGIAQAQTALDQNSIKTQELIDSDPVASHYGLQAAWYQFPKVDLDLKLSLTVAQDQSSAPPAPAAPAGVRALFPMLASRLSPVRLVAQPVSASYQNHFNFDATAASSLTLSIVPVPPQRGSQGVQPSMTVSKVKAAAFASAAKFLLAKDAQNNVLKDPDGVPIPATTDAAGNALRLDTNFNGAAGLWYVLQYAPLNTAVPSVVVAVDDAVGSQPGIDLKTAVRIISTP